MSQTLSTTDRYRRRIDEFTEIVRHEDGEAGDETRAGIRNAGFDPDTSLFVTLVESDDGIEYTMFVAADGKIWELERCVRGTKPVKVWEAGLEDAIKLYPDIAVAVEMMREGVAV